MDRRPYILTATLENSSRRSDSEARLQASDRTQCGPASRQTTNFRPKVDLLTLKTRVNDASTLICINTILFYKTARIPIHDFTKLLSYSRIFDIYINKYKYTRITRLLIYIRETLLEDFRKVEGRIDLFKRLAFQRIIN